MPPPVNRDALGRLAPGSVISRPKNRAPLMKLIDKWLGEDAEDAIAFLAGVVKGTQTIPARAPGVNEDRVSMALIPDVVPTIRERLQAAEIVMSYRHGLPKAHVEISGQVEHSAAPALNYAALSESELAHLEALAQKALPSEAAIDVTPTKGSES